MPYYTATFKRDDGKTELQIECELASEGRGLGIYVVSHEILDAYGVDPLTDDEETRLSEEVAENDEAIEIWEDRGSWED